jgi:Mycothiol maleylpyruvate isomerase N-terminal domain
MIDSSSIGVVLQAYRPERDALLELLRELAPRDWTRPTECPAYPIKGIATHVLGDDLSLLSRQRDGAVQGLLYRLPHASRRL